MTGKILKSIGDVKLRRIIAIAVTVLVLGGVAAVLIQRHTQPIEEYLKAILIKEGPDRALAATERILEQRGFGKDRCHVVLHVLGRAAFEHFRDFGTAVGSPGVASGICTAGYIHGVIENFFGHSDNPLAAAEAVCERYRNVNPQLYGNCLHGIGHGFMFYTNDDLPKSLYLCDQLPEGGQTCSNGVFMENFNASITVGHPTDYVRADDLFYPCNTEGIKYKQECYYYAPDQFLALYPRQYKEALEWCLEAGPANQNHCIERVGNRAFQDNYPDEEFAQNLCANATEENTRAECFEGIARGYKYFFNSVERAREFCQKTVRPQYRQWCPAEFL